MADKASEKRPESALSAPTGAEKRAAGGGLLAKTPVVMGGVMILEAAVLFAGFKFLGGGGPRHAVAIELSTGEKGVDGKGIDAGGNRKKLIEINIVDFKAPN